MLKLRRTEQNSLSQRAKGEMLGREDRVAALVARRFFWFLASLFLVGKGAQEFDFML